MLHKSTLHDHGWSSLSVSGSQLSSWSVCWWRCFFVSSPTSAGSSCPKQQQKNYLPTNRCMQQGCFASHKHMSADNFYSFDEILSAFFFFRYRSKKKKKRGSAPSPLSFLITWGLPCPFVLTPLSCVILLLIKSNKYSCPPASKKILKLIGSWQHG